MLEGLERDSAVDKGGAGCRSSTTWGSSAFVVGPLFTNLPCVFLPTASFVRAPRLWLDKIHEHRGTLTYAPNFAYALVAKRLKDKDVEGLDLRCLRVAGCGAEPIQARALRDFAAKLAPAGFDPRAFLPSYGMAEATLAITFVPLKEGLRTDENEARQGARRLRPPIRRPRGGHRRRGGGAPGREADRADRHARAERHEGLLPGAGAHGADLQAAAG